VDFVVRNQLQKIVNLTPLLTRAKQQGFNVEYNKSKCRSLLPVLIHAENSLFPPVMHLSMVGHCKKI
jgi:hypothetical protein